MSRNATLARKKMTSDRVYAKLKSALGEITFDAPSMLEEANRLHKSRKLRGIHDKGKIPKATKLLDLHFQEQAYRSRLVEIRTNAYLVQANLLAMQEAVARILQTEYSDYLADFRTKDDRSNFVYSLPSMEQATNIIESTSTILEVCDMFILDIDKAGYGLTNATKLLELIINGRV